MTPDIDSLVGPPFVRRRGKTAVIGLALLLGLTSANSAQGVDGMVVDLHGRAMPNIVVTLVDSVAHVVGTTRTANDGVFSIDAPAPGRYRIGFTNDSTALGQSARFSLAGGEFAQRRFIIEPVEHPFLLDFQVTRRATTVDPHLRFPMAVTPDEPRTPASVVVQFVVDTTGRVDMSSWRAIAGNSAAMSSGVRNAIAAAAFHPAVVVDATGEHKVRQLVELSFAFGGKP
jgi:hypothetical protein